MQIDHVDHLVLPVQTLETSCELWLCAPVLGIQLRAV